jgi:acetyl esterase
MKNATLYWIVTGLLAAWLTLGGVLDTARVGATRTIMETLHYPDYMLLILGPAKLLAVLALLYPRTRLLREWAYAGIAIDGLGAFLSHCAVHDTLSHRVSPLIFVAVAAASYLLRPQAMRLSLPSPIRAAAVILLLVCAPIGSAAPLDRQDVEYARPDGKSLLLDLHIPDGPGPFPAAILIHGGGFDEGSKSTNVRPLFAPLTDAGVAWFSIDYRLAPAVHFPEAIEDVRSAIRWVHTHAAEYHVDPVKIAIIGESAGGFFVNYIGTHETADTRVAAVVDFYGPSDYGKLALLRREHPERFNMATIHRHAAHGGGIHFFGVDQLDAAGLAKLHALAPIAAVHKGMPPFLVIHGTKDDQVDYEQSTEFCHAIDAVGAACQLIPIEGGGHGMGGWCAPEMQHWKPEMLAWLDKTLRKTE